MDRSSIVALAEVVREARTWREVPFLHQGRSRRGIDCAGLVIAVAWALELSEFDFTGYHRRPDGRELKAICDREMLAVRVDRFGPGNVILFRNTENHPQHLGIVGDYRGGDGHSVIHASEPDRRVVEVRLDRARLHFLVAAYALPGTA